MIELGMVASSAIAIEAPRVFPPRLPAMRQNLLNSRIPFTLQVGHRPKFTWSE